MSGTIRILPRDCSLTQGKESPLASFIQIPLSRVPPDTLQALLEEYASRDGTDYGERESTLDERVASLRKHLADGRLALLYDGDSETWDIVGEEDASRLLGEEGSS